MTSEAATAKRQAHHTETADAAGISWDVREPEISPSWIGGDGRFYTGVSSTGEALLRRDLTAESAPYATDPQAMLALMRAAGEQGLAPAIVSASGTSVVMERLEAPWATARANDLADPAVLDAALSVRRQVHGLGGLTDRLPVRTLVEDVYAMRDLCREEGVRAPFYLDGILAGLEPFIARADTLREPAVPCHGDGAASNLLIDKGAGREGGPDVRLTGWTVCGLRDPVEEAGSVLSEAFPFFEAPPARMLEGLGLDAEALLPAECYAVLDGLFWAMVGLHRSATTKTPQVDFAKYGLWRLEKCRFQFFTTRLQTWLEDIR